MAEEEKELAVSGFIISKVEEIYGVKYIGEYDIRPGSFSPMLVFYQADPKTELGHSHYMGLYRHAVTGEPYVTNAEKILECEYPAVELEDGTFLVSRYRHDYQAGPRGEMVDGGIDYTRCNPKFPVRYSVIIVEDQEVIVQSFAYWLEQLNALFAEWKGEYNTAERWMPIDWWRILWRREQKTPAQALEEYKKQVQIFGEGDAAL